MQLAFLHRPGVPRYDLREWCLAALISRQALTGIFYSEIPSMRCFGTGFQLLHWYLGRGKS